MEYSTKDYLKLIRRELEKILIFLDHIILITINQTSSN